jgi:sugar phosphate permease
MVTGQRVAKAARGMFFGWWIVAAGIGVQSLIAALLSHAYGAYIVVLKESFGWSTTTFSVAYSMQRAESGLLGPLQGWLLDRFGPRVVMTAGMSMLGVGFILFSRINSPTTFYLAFLVMAVGVSLGGFMSITTTVVNWFERRRGTALGIMQTGGAIGGLLLPLVAWSLTANGWRATAFASGLIVLALGLPLAQLMRRSPEEYGLEPDGSRPIDAGPLPQVGRATSFTAREAMRTRVFWYLIAGHSLAVMVVTTVSVHLIPYLTSELDLGLATASSIVALMTVTLMAGQLSGGVLGDRFSKRWLAAFATTGHAVAMLLLAAAPGLGVVVAAVLIHGFAHGFRGVQMMPIRADYFGRQAFGKIMGFTFMFMMWGEVGGPIGMGLLVDNLGNYRLGFGLLSAVAALGAVFFAISGQPPRPPRAEAARRAS